MINLKGYLLSSDSKSVSNNINEGLLSAGIKLMYLNKMSSKELMDGILNMYDYIADKTDIKLFYKDFPLRQQPFWKSLYKLYEANAWSMYDVSDKKITHQLDNIQKNTIIKITPELRHDIRQIQKASRVSNVGDNQINPNLIESLIYFEDPKYKTPFIFTTNKLTGIKGLFRMADKKIMEKIFEKIAMSAK